MEDEEYLAELRQRAEERRLVEETASDERTREKKTLLRSWNEKAAGIERLAGKLVDHLNRRSIPPEVHLDYYWFQYPLYRKRRLFRRPVDEEPRRISAGDYYGWPVVEVPRTVFSDVGSGNSTATDGILLTTGGELLWFAVGGAPPLARGQETRTVSEMLDGGGMGGRRPVVPVGKADIVFLQSGGLYGTNLPGSPSRLGQNLSYKFDELERGVGGLADRYQVDLLQE